MFVEEIYSDFAQLLKLIDKDDPSDIESILEQCTEEIYNTFVDTYMIYCTTTSELGLSICRISVTLQVCGKLFLFPTIVHAFQYRKLEYDERFLQDGIKIMVVKHLQTMSIKKVLEWGNSHRIHLKHNEWKAARFSVMEALLYEAMLQNSDLRARLLQTSGDILEDISKTWNYPGSNTLGKLWVNVRERLRSNEI